MHTHTHTLLRMHFSQSFNTLTINLQPIAQLCGVAMANILSSESSAADSKREGITLNVMKGGQTCEQKASE